MKKQLFIVCLLTLLALPGIVFAASHEHSGHGTKTKGDMHKGMITVGEQTVDGVKAIVYLNDVKATMAKMGMKETHHLMIHFYAKNGKTIEEGTVAAKIKGPDGKEGGAIKMIGMDAHFGADIVLDRKGSYLFTVGTKLVDGVTRQFELRFELK